MSGGYKKLLVYFVIPVAMYFFTIKVTFY